MNFKSRLKSIFDLFNSSSKKAFKSTDDLSSSRHIYINIEPSNISNKNVKKNVSDEEGWIPPVYTSNYVRTTKYTKFTFIPKNLFEQFQRAANIYFSFLICLQLIPKIGNGIQAAIMGTFSFLTILLMTMAKDGYEDFNRYKSDNELNNRPCRKLADWNNINILNKPPAAVHAIETNCQFDDTASETDQPLMDSSDDVQLEKISSSDNCNLDCLNDWSEILWKNVQVGDIIKLRRDEAIPADMVILSSSEFDGICFVETKNLDGETNLKTRQGLKTTASITSSQKWKYFSGYIDSELPNPNLYAYNGSFYLLEPSEQTYITSTQEPISNQNILLRGCIVRNVDFVIGIVIYTGNDSKIILNSGSTPSKKSYIENMMNTQVMINFIILFTMAVIVSVISGVWYESTETSFHYFGFGYITGLKNGVFTALVGFFSCLILFQNIVPISLYLTVEVVKSVQAYFIHSDLDMYHEETDTPCVPKAWNLSDDLGQIEYLFSDKTGTLTQNVMEFKQCTIGGIIYGEYNPTTSEIIHTTENQSENYLSAYPNEEEAFSDVSSTSSISSVSNIDPSKAMYDERDRLCNNKYRSGKLSFIDPRIYYDIRNQPTRANLIKEFFTILAICHTVLTDIDPNTEQEINYNAESPDEAALVAAATNVGFTFLARSQDQVQVNILGDVINYKILHILEFNSTRKRMSVLVQFPDSEDIHLFCKGADSIIMERLAVGNENLKLQTLNDLKLFAKTGLRTLCIASRIIPRSEYLKWEVDYNNALNRLDNRDFHVAKLCEIIECDLTLVGGTAIEDKLQEGVPDSIALLRESGIKIWVLTGDKIETAMNIGFSCNLITQDMSLITIDGENKEEVGKQILEALSRCLVGGTSFNFALVIDGSSLKYALDDSLRNDFLEVGKNCRVVLCCRVSPLQKAQVVLMVKQGLNAMTLAIGDGANDVSMIQAAHIGVGISGLEGYQAVMASDYAIAQFRYLSKLLIVHGRWCYLRVSHMILCFFYKNLLMTLTNFWFQFYNGPSQTFLFEYALVLLYNLVFTAFPIIVLGSFDQDVQARVALVTPQLYMSGILHEEYNHKRFWLIVFDALYQSLICFFTPFIMFYWGTFSMSGNSTNSLDGFGTVVVACVVVTSNLYVGLWTYYWNFMMFAVIGFSILFFFITIFSLSQFIPALKSVDVLLFTTLNFWIVLGFAVTASLLPRLIARYIDIIFNPNNSDIIREQVLIYSNYIRRQSRRLKKLRRRNQRSDVQSSLVGRLFSSSKDNNYTGYAFSMEESSPLSRRLRESILKSHVEVTLASTEHAAKLAAILDDPPENFNIPLESNNNNASSGSEKSKAPLNPEKQFLNINTMGPDIRNSCLSPMDAPVSRVPDIRVTPPTIKRSSRYPEKSELPPSE